MQIQINLVPAEARIALKKRERLRRASLRFTQSEKGMTQRKRWRDTHPENIRKATMTYRAKMTPEERKQTAKKHRDNVVSKLRNKLREAKKRAAQQGRAFDDALFDAVLASPPTHCACCGIELDYRTEGFRHAARGKSPSIDRIDNARGYTLDNTFFVCFRCNALKSDATINELETIVRYMKRHLA